MLRMLGMDMASILFMMEGNIRENGKEASIMDGEL